MVGSVEQIEYDIAALEKAVGKLAGELHQAYATYLNNLGKAIRQQLIMATYQICTQGHPEEFLELSTSDRQRLQQLIRQLAQQVQEELRNHLEMPILGKNLAERIGLAVSPRATNEPRLEAAQPGESGGKPAPSLPPDDLLYWQENLEDAIYQELQVTSHAVNRLLQQFDILPKQLPEEILQAEQRSEAMLSSSVPNLMNLLVEVRDERANLEAELEQEAELEDSSEVPVIHIVAIHLRLAEIEFTDATVNTDRTRIRTLVARLKALNQEHQRKQRDWAIARAQAAWRATWTEA
jgi:hypothetical protein